MVNLLALVLVTWATAHSSAPIDDRRQLQQMSQAHRSAVTLTPKQKAWFAHAIDDILRER